MHNDDRTSGRVLSRREVMTILGSSGAMLLTGCASSTPGSGADTAAAAAGAGGSVAGMSGCVVRPRSTEGPYFVDEMLNRADIRSDPTNGTVKAGTPLALTINVSRLSGAECAPLAGAMVDLWQCDAEGVYSDARDRSFNTVGQKFLRGYQLTDDAGNARFTTIYPGWYAGRTVHLHFKIRSPQTARAPWDFTSQLYFDDGLTDQVHAQGVYLARGQRDARNERDGIFRNEGGRELMLDVRPAGGGYASTFNVAVQA